MGFHNFEPTPDECSKSKTQYRTDYEVNDDCLESNCALDEAEDEPHPNGHDPQERNRDERLECVVSKSHDDKSSTELVTLGKQMTTSVDEVELVLEENKDDANDAQSSEDAGNEQVQSDERSNDSHDRLLELRLIK